MSIVFIPETFHSEKNNKDYYVIRVAIQKDGMILRKSSPILWLTKEQYEDYTSKN